MGVFALRKLFALLAAFAMTASQALAFDHLTAPVGQVYFSIPFGAPTKQEATPRLGFRVDYGYGSTLDDVRARAPYSPVDWRLNLDGQTSLRLNGVDVGQLPRPLYIAEDGGKRTWEFALLLIIGFASIAYIRYD